MKHITQDLLSTTEIGFDGHLRKEPTFLGAVLIVLTGAAISCALFYAVLWVAALFQISSK